MKGTSRLVLSIVFVGVLVLGAVLGFLTSLRPLLGLDLVGGISVTLAAPPGTSKDVVEKALDRIRDRVDALGVAEPDISLIGGNNIQVQLPGLGGQGHVVKKGALFCALSSTNKEIGCFTTEEKATAHAKAASVQRVLQLIGTTARLEERELLGQIAPTDPAYKTTQLPPRDPST